MSPKRSDDSTLGILLLVGLLLIVFVLAWELAVLALVATWCVLWTLGYLIAVGLAALARTREAGRRLLGTLGETPLTRTSWLWVRLLTFGFRRPGKAPQGPVPVEAPPARSWAWAAGVVVVLVLASAVGAANSGKPTRVEASPAGTGTPSSPAGPSGYSPVATASVPVPATASPHHPARRPRHKPSPLPAPNCPANALRGVYHPYRLDVLGTCRWYQGVVTSVRHEADGDYHVDIRPDPGFAHFLDHDNVAYQNGSLVTEVMPGQHLPIPGVGEHVAVFGTWVHDSDHGWNEIHPIWAIRYSSRGYLRYSLPVVPPVHDGGGGSGGGSTVGGSGDCDPNYTGACLKDGIGDYDCYGGSGNGPNYTPPGVVIHVVGTDVFDLDSDHDGLACE